MPRYCRAGSFALRLFLVATGIGLAVVTSSSASQRYWSVSGKLGANASIDPVFEYSGPNRPAGHGSCTWRIEVVDSSGLSLFTRHFTPATMVDVRRPNVAFANPYLADSESRNFSELIPVTAKAQRIQILDDANTVRAERKLDGVAPVVHLNPLPNGTLWGKHTIGWTVVDPRTTTFSYELFYSPDPDRGKQWLRIGKGSDKGAVDGDLDLNGAGNGSSNGSTWASVDFDRLPGADGTARIKVLVSDGAHATTVISDPFTVARKPPKVAPYLLHDGDTVPPGVPVRFGASATDREDDLLDGSTVQWSSDLDGVLGTGQSLDAKLSAGRHVITVTAMDSDGNTVSASTKARVVDPARASLPDIEQADTTPLPAHGPSAAARKPGGAPPTVRLLPVPAGRLWGEHQVGWTVADTDSSSFTYVLYYSPDPDNGKEWMSISAGDGKGKGKTWETVDFDRLRGSHGSARLKVVVSDGVNTATAISAPLTVARKPPTATILAPIANAVVPRDEPVQFEVSAFDREDDQLDGAAVHWSSNLDGALGTGQRMVARLSPGRHLITMIAKDSDGNTISENRMIQVTGLASVWSLGMGQEDVAALPTRSAPAPLAGQASAVARGPVTAKEERYWRVSGSHTPRVSIDPLFEYSGSLPPDSETCAWRIEVRDAAERALFTRYFTPSRTEADTFGPINITPSPYFHEMIPVIAGANRIVILNSANTVVAERSLAGASPIVRLSPLPEGTLSGEQKISWTVKGLGSRQASAEIFYSVDAGKTWEPILTGEVTSPSVLDFDELPGARGTAMIKVVVSDGAHAAEARSRPFTVARKPPAAEIQWPKGDPARAAEDPVWFEAWVQDPEDGLLDGSAIQWSSNLDGMLGNGARLETTLNPGRHVITMTAKDSDGNTVTSSSTVRVAKKPPELTLEIKRVGPTPSSCVEVTINAKAFPPVAVSDVYYGLNVKSAADYIRVPPHSLPFKFVVPGSGRFQLDASATDEAGHRDVQERFFNIDAPCETQIGSAGDGARPAASGGMPIRR